MKRQLRVSLVIPTYNRLMKLVRLLKSLNQLNPLPEEVIIIDDHSEDQTAELLNRWKAINNGFKKKIILKTQNKGPAHSRNIGIEKATHGLLAFVDDDVVVKSNWVKNIAVPLINSSKKLAGVGGVVKALNKHIISKYYVIHRTLEAPIEMNYLPTVNCCFKKAHLEEIGGFDSSFPFAGGEDTDLCLRLKKEGFHFKKSQDAIVYHDFSPKFLDFCRTWFRYGKGTNLAIQNLWRTLLD